MAGIDVILPWDSQPQEVADLDSRFTWGVNFAGGPSSIEIAAKTFGTPTGSPTRAATPQGVGVKLVSGSSQHWIGPVARLPTAFPITFVATFTLDSLAVSARIFQSGMTYNYAGVYFWVFTNGAGTVGYGNNTDITTGTGNFQINFPAGTFVAGQTYTVSACCTAGNIVASVNGGEIAGTSLTGSSTTIVTTGSPNVGRLQYAGLELYTDATISLVALGGFNSPQGELNGYSSNPWQLFAPRSIWVPVSAGGATTHDTTGALTGAGSTVAGTAAHIAKHATSGALTGQGASVVGSAARTRVHPSSGALTGPGSVIDGAAARAGAATTHDTSGALTGQGAAVAGTAAHIAIHATSGVLTGAGALIAGIAARVAAAVTHDTSGDLIGPGASMSGEAALPAAFKLGGSPGWNPYEKRGETEEQKRTRRIAQGIIREAQKPAADIARLSRRAATVSEKLKADVAYYEAEAAKYATEIEQSKQAIALVMQAKNDALATRQLEQRMIAAQLQAEAAAQQAEELDVVFMAAMLAAMEV